MQGEKIKNFLVNNGKKASNWQTAGYGLLGLSTTTAFLVFMIFAAPTKEYEKSITVEKNVNLYYNKDIDDLTPQKITKVIKQSGFIENSEEADIFLSTERDFYRLKFVLLNTSVLSDSLFLNGFNGLEKYLNYNLNLDKRIEIGFTDVNLQESFELKESKPDSQLVYERLLRSHYLVGIYQDCSALSLCSHILFLLCHKLPNGELT